MHDTINHKKEHKVLDKIEHKIVGKIWQNKMYTMMVRYNTSHISKK